MKKLLFAALLTLAVFFAPVFAQYNTAWRNIQGQAIASAFQSGATFQVWSTSTIPTDANATVSGTLLADGDVPGANVTFNSTTSLLTLGGLSDPAINVTGNPNLIRVIDDSGARAQFTAKMSADAGTAQVTITDSVDVNATQLLQNRPLNLSISLQY